MIKDAVNFYYKAAQLKELLRQGAVQWKVNRARLESIAEHCFGCSILAIAIQSELNLKVDLGKVLEMLAIHELEEIFIGDITIFGNVNKQDLTNKTMKKIEKLLAPLNKKERLLNLLNEFNNCSSEEAKFAKAIDKLECVLEFKKYHDLGQVSLKNTTEEMFANQKFANLAKSGKYDLSDIFFIYHKAAYEEYSIDEKFWFSTLKKLKI